MPNKHYDLEERTAKFGGSMVEFTRSFGKDPLLLPILIQLVRAGTSIGANYCEANGASSKKDFTNKIFICKKEAKETKYWLGILVQAIPIESARCKPLLQEAQELTLIFSKIASNSRNVNSV